MTPRRIPVEPAGASATAELTEQDEPYRAAVAEALAEWIDFRLAHAGGDAGTGVREARRIGALVEDLVVAEQRRAVLFALGSGRSLADVGADLEVSRWAVGKRWPDLVEQALPLRWLCTNQELWSTALDNLLTQEEQQAKRLDSKQRQALTELREAVNAHHDHADNWWLLLGTPQLARIVVGHQPPDDFDHVLAHDWIHALVADFDRTCTGDKTKPRAEVTRAAVRAATQNRLGHAH